MGGIARLQVTITSVQVQPVSFHDKISNVFEMYTARGKPLHQLIRYLKYTRFLRAEYSIKRDERLRGECSYLLFL